jgi:hypothetical protein
MKKIVLAAVATASIGLASAGGVTKSLNRDYWTGIKGVDASDLLKSEAYKGEPTGSDELKAGFKAVSWKDGKTDQRWAATFGEKIYGYLVAPTTGTYTFALSNDDGAELFLSSDATPENKKSILKHRISPYGKWSKNSPPIQLEAGKAYYVELIHKENSGNTYSLVGWKTPGGDKVELIPADVLSSFKAGVPTK